MSDTIQLKKTAELAHPPATTINTPANRTPETDEKVLAAIEAAIAHVTPRTNQAAKVIKAKLAQIIGIDGDPAELEKLQVTITPYPKPTAESKKLLRYRLEISSNDEKIIRALNSLDDSIKDFINNPRRSYIDRSLTKEFLIEHPVPSKTNAAEDGEVAVTEQAAEGETKPTILAYSASLDNNLVRILNDAYFENHNAKIVYWRDVAEISPDQNAATGREVEKMFADRDIARYEQALGKPMTPEQKEIFYRKAELRAARDTALGY